MSHSCQPAHSHVNLHLSLSQSPSHGRQNSVFTVMRALRNVDRRTAPPAKGFHDSEDHLRLSSLVSVHSKVAGCQCGTHCGGGSGGARTFAHAQLLAATGSPERIDILRPLKMHSFLNCTTYRSKYRKRRVVRVDTDRVTSTFGPRHSTCLN